MKKTHLHAARRTKTAPPARARSKPTVHVVARPRVVASIKAAPGGRATTTGGGNGGSLLHSAPTLNGVNGSELVLMSEAIRRDPKKAEYGFRAETHWVGGGHSRTRVQDFWGAGKEDHSRARPFTIQADEPEILLGTNEAPNAVEAALSAIGSCLAAGIAYNAAAKGIELQGIDIELEGDMDLRGFLGMANGDSGVRPGFKDVRVVCRIRSDVPPSQIKELLEQVENTSPLLDVFRNPVPVKVELEH